MIVTQEENNPSDNYYNSLSNALCSIWQRYTIVYLTEGTHKLVAVTLDKDDMDCSDIYLPLSRDEEQYLNVKIMTALCSLIDIENCSDEAATIQTTIYPVRLNAPNYMYLTISGIIYDGANSLMNSTCTSADRCSYCPYFVKKGSLYLVDDRGEVYGKDEVQYASNCESYNTFNFISTTMGSLTLSAVTIKNFRQQYSSLIYASNSEVTLSNVAFDNVQTYPKSVIYLECKDSTASTCMFSYSGGSVTRLNNGYEYRDGISQCGFLSITKYNTVTLESLTFTKNLVLKTVAADENLISIKATYMTNVIKDLTFDTNIVSAALINFDSTDLIYLKVEIDSNGYSIQHTQTHLTISGVKLDHNSCTTAINVIEGSQAINAKIELKSTTNYIIDSIIKAMRSSTMTNSDKYGGSFSFNEDNGKVTAYTNPYLIEISNLEFTGSIAGQALASFNNIPKLKMSSSSFLNVQKSDVMTINDVSVQAFIDDDEAYMNQKITDFDPVYCGGIISLTSLNSFEATSSNWDNYYCTNAGGGIALKDQSGPVYLTDLTFSRLSSNVTDSAAITASQGSNELSIVSCSFSSLNIGWIAVKSQTYLTVRKCTFEGSNSGEGTSGIEASVKSTLVLTDLTFKDLSVVSSILISIIGEGNSVYTFLDTLNFSNIKTTSSLTSIMVSGATVNLNWINLTFDNVQSDTTSILLIASESVLSDDSKITGLKATNLKELSDETTSQSISINLAGGSLTIADSSFSNSVVHSIMKTSLNKNSYLQINNTTFKNITATVLLSLGESSSKSTVITRNCVFTDNKAKAVTVFSANWVDFSSVIQGQTIGGVFGNLASMSMTNTQFLSNSNKSDNGGAVQLSFKCTFTCVSCNFDSNSAITGGAVRLDQSSTLNISKSTFTNNSSLSGGAVLYIISSSQANVMTDCTVTTNKTGTSGTITLVEAVLTVMNTIIKNNTVGSSAAGFYLNSSTLVCQLCVITDQTALSASFGSIMTQSKVNFKDCTFARGSTELSGGGFIVSDSEASFDGCTANKVSSKGEGGFMNMIGQR